MLPALFIEEKKRGLEHKPDDILEFIMGYVDGEIPDYQMAAWLMAVNFQGMTNSETISLVATMLYSGDRIDLSHIPHLKVDKHSTGGVGDKVSLILAPLAAAAGCYVPMISGRGLAHSGGTLDKLESIPGFNVNLTKEEFVQLVEKSGMGMMGQTEKICPADRKMYALRDVTATVKSLPLICGSILSKKIAEGIDGLVLDVKTGNGAFLIDYNECQKLARLLKSVGEYFGLKVKACITDMNQPLGRNVGNWLEVIESIDVLKGKGPADLREVTLYLTTWMIVLAGIEKDFRRGKERAEKALNSGQAYQKFLEMVRNQGGDLQMIENPDRYDKAGHIYPVTAEETGFVQSIDTFHIGMAAMELGAGRRRVTDRIVPEVGIEIEKKIADSVSKGENLAVIHATDEESWQSAAETVRRAFVIKPSKCSPPTLVYETF